MATRNWCTGIIVSFSVKIYSNFIDYRVHPQST
jgi:hypothetical protein